MFSKCKQFCSKTKDVVVFGVTRGFVGVGIVAINCLGFAGRAATGVVKAYNYFKKEQGVPIEVRLQSRPALILSTISAVGVTLFVGITRAPRVWEFFFPPKKKDSDKALVDLTSNTVKTVTQRPGNKTPIKNPTGCWKVLSTTGIVIGFLQGGVVTAMSTYRGGMTEFNMADKSAAPSDPYEIGFAGYLTLISFGVYILYNLQVNVIPNINQAVAFIQQKLNPPTDADLDALEKHKLEYAIHLKTAIATVLISVPNIISANVLTKYGTSFSLPDTPLLNLMPRSCDEIFSQIAGVVGAVTCMTTFSPSLYRLLKKTFVDQQTERALKKGLGILLLYGLGNIGSLVDSAGGAIFTYVSAANTFSEEFGGTPYSNAIMACSGIVAVCSFLCVAANYKENLENIFFENVKKSTQPIVAKPPRRKIKAASARGYHSLDDASETDFSVTTPDDAAHEDDLYSRKRTITRSLSGPDAARVYHPDDAENHADVKVIVVDLPTDSTHEQDQESQPDSPKNVGGAVVPYVKQSRHVTMFSDIGINVPSPGANAAYTQPLLFTVAVPAQPAGDHEKTVLVGKSSDEVGKTPYLTFGSSGDNV